MLPRRLKYVIDSYCKSIEHKSLALDGSKCTEETKGLLRRRPIRASGVFHRIGKEVDRGTSTDPEYYSDEPLAKYGKSAIGFPRLCGDIPAASLPGARDCRRKQFGRHGKTSYSHAQKQRHDCCGTLALFRMARIGACTGMAEPGALDLRSIVLGAEAERVPS